MKPEQEFSKSAFIDAIVVDYSDRRRASFVKDQTAEVLYKDRNNMSNFYNSPKGVVVMRREARRELGLDQPGQSPQAASFAA